MLDKNKNLPLFNNINFKMNIHYLENVTRNITSKTAVIK